MRAPREGGCSPSAHDGFAVSPDIDRRTLVRRSILLVGGAITGLPQALAQPRGHGFSEARGRLFSAYADILIPATDTPGALAAGVPASVDALMRNWASAATAAQLGATLDALDEAARKTGRAGLLALPAVEQVAAVRLFDAARIAARDPGYLRLKDLVLITYYLSEPGATRELRYELVPGGWEASIPLDPDQRAWAV